MVFSEKIDPEGHAVKSRSDNDPSTSTNKHLTRLVRFSILQARRSSQVSKAVQQSRKVTDTSQEHCPPSPPGATSPHNHDRLCQHKSRDSPVHKAATKFPFDSFASDKERPSTELQDDYNDVPGHVNEEIGVVDVPANPPIMEDLSASLTLSAGEHSGYSESLSEDCGIENDEEDMDLLLAPDSESDMLHACSSNEVYNSAEMYSSSGNYDDSGHSSDISSDSSDSIMRRVEEEIANARKASNDAQARLAYFTQKQKELSPVMTDSYSFDIENLETSGDMQSMLDVDECEGFVPNRANQWRLNGGGTIYDDNFNKAMGVIGKEFDTGSTDVEEKVDIEVVLAPSIQKVAPQKPKTRAHRSPAKNRLPPWAPTRSPRSCADESDDIDGAVISAVFSEKSIESLPVRESLQPVFSEQSMESLPIQPAQSSIGRPSSYSFQESSCSDYAVSPASQKRHNMLLPIMSKAVSPCQRSLEANLSSEADGKFTTKASASPLSTAASPCKLPSTPREPNTPSYRERLENKLKILGSRYPVSPSSKAGTPTNKKEASRVSLEKRPRSISPSKASKSELDKPVTDTPRDEMSLPTVLTSPLGEAYDGLESRIKDLLARTLNPGPSELAKVGEKELAYQSSPSAELKAIKKLLEQGVAAGAASEERKRELQECQEQEEPRVIPAASAFPESKSKYIEEQQKQADHLHFPVLEEYEEYTIEEASEEQSQSSKSKSNDTRGSESNNERWHMRSNVTVPPVETADGAKDPEPTVTYSTSEEILEALVSFSRSTEFKSRISPTSKPSSSKSAAIDESTPHTQVKTDLQRNEGHHEAYIRQQKVADNSSYTKGGTLVASLKSYIENAIKPAKDVALKRSRVKEGKDEALLRSESRVDRADTDSIETVSISGSVQEAVPRHENPDLKTCTKTTNNASIDVDSHGRQYDERSVYESCAEPAAIDDGRNDGIAFTTAESKPAFFQTQRTRSCEMNSSPTPKKTPSVLNAALSRSSLTDVKDRRNNERKVRQKAVNKHASCEEKTESDTDASVASPGSQATNGGSAEQVPSSSADEISERSADNADHTPHAQPIDHCTTENPSVSEPVLSFSFLTEGNREADMQPRPRDEIELEEGENARDLRKEQSVLASVLEPSKWQEPQTLPPLKAAASGPNEKDKVCGEAIRDAPSISMRGKSTTASSLTSSAEDSDERVLQTKNDNSKAKPSVNRSDRKIRFRDPYPTPKPCSKPRSTEEIQRDYSIKPSQNEWKTRWKEPKGDLKQLLFAALDASVSRRSNACGALKVISKLEKNKVILVRTKGFLEALVFVATDEITSDEPEAKEDARARAISCLYNVSHVKENRLLVCTHHGLLECLVKTIKEDRGEARMEACGIMAQLAKSPLCRDLMVDEEELLSTLASVLKGTIDPEEKMLALLSEDGTEGILSSYSEMSSLLSEEHTPFPKSPGDDGKHQRTQNKVRTNCSIRRQKSEMYDQYFELARLSSCAALIHLSKQCSVLHHFCSNMFLLESIVQVARDTKCTLHGKCLEMLCNISRLPGNTAVMTRFPGMVDTLVGVGSAKDAMDRIWALRTLQNMTSDASSKAPLATSTLLTLLITCVTSKYNDEQHAAMATLLNLSTDPSAVVPITSTKNVLATLVYLAHNSDSTSKIRMMACNALATVGLWLQTVAGFGSIPEETRRVLLPSHKTTGWEVWN